jgi:trehalose 6-phosphate phosphatase
MSDFLFNYSTTINRNILRSNSIFLFLDYDGTLVPFKDKPTEVITPNKIKQIIKKLIKNPKIKVIIVTGRPLYEIKKLLNIKGLSFIALHGLHIEEANGLKSKWKQANQARMLIKAIKKDMQPALKYEKGTFLEDKELTLVLHYRLLPTNKVQVIRKKFKKVVRTIDKKKILEIINGAKLIETRPKGWHKGKAVEKFLTSQIKVKNYLPIFIGDDITDEDAFRILEKRGITIYVANKSKRKTAAQYWVKDPDDVFTFLQSLTK